MIENRRVEFKNVGINVGTNEGNDDINNQKMTKKQPRIDQEESKNQEVISLTNCQKRIVEEISLNHEITINDLAKILDCGTRKIKTDIKYLRENRMISRTGSTKSRFWVVKK